MDLYIYKVANYRVVDGDTLDVTLDLGFNTFRKEKIRLARINAPEIGCDAGVLAKSHLSDLLDNCVLFIQTKKDGRDKYGRYIGEVWAEISVGIDVKKVVNVNDQMVADNAAVFKDYR